MNQDFCAIDFETATYRRNSACSIGMVRVRAGRIDGEFQSLINQKDTKFQPINVQIHGITAAMTANSPSFAELWPDIRAFIGELPLAAHSAGFDISVLKAMLQEAGIVWDIPEYHCSCQAARTAWPCLDSHRLDVVAEHLGIELDHHDALSDARACALILLKAGCGSGA